jgi:uncharacterized protein (TIGR02145 family)
MRFQRILFLLAGLCLLVPQACKKEEETTTKPSLSGAWFNLPVFGRVGQTFNLEQKGTISTSDGKDPGTLSTLWVVDKDTLKTASFTASSTGTFTVTCTVSAAEYYSTVASRSIHIIDPSFEKTVTDTGINASDLSIQDARESIAGENRYYYLPIYGLKWFRNNLAYTGSGMAYENSDVTSYPLGRFYTWEEATTACPQGWRLPTLEEMESLGDVAGDLMADAFIEGARLWEFWPQVKITNRYYFAAIPSGYAIRGEDTSPAFFGWKKYACFWTATSNPADDSQAFYRYLFVEDPVAKTALGDKASLALSVRCVQ